MRERIAFVALLLAAACNSSPQSQAARPQPEYTAAVDLPASPERTALQTNCQICHGSDIYESQRLSKVVWEAEITKMMKFGAPLPPSQKEAVVEYLARYLGPTVPRVSALPVVTPVPITYTGPP